MSHTHLSSTSHRINRVRIKINSVKQGHKLVVFKSLRNISAQLVDLKTGATLSTVVGKSPAEVGIQIAQKALKLKITNIIFDRGRYQFHGQVKVLADAARQTGLRF